MTSRLLIGFLFIYSCFGQFFGGTDPHWYAAGSGPLASLPGTCDAQRQAYMCVGAGCPTDGCYYYCAGVTSATVFTGGGLNDLTRTGIASGIVPVAIRVRIDASIPTPDTFQWSIDGGASWVASGVSITAGVAQALSNGFSVTFAAGDGHTVGDRWDWTVGTWSACSSMGGVFVTPGTAYNFTYYSGGTTLDSAGNATDGFIWNPTLITATLRNDAIGATSTDGLVIENQTAAAGGVQQWSPRLRFTGRGWKTAAGGASQVVDWSLENVPTQGVTNPATNLNFSHQVNGGAYIPTWTMSNDPATALLDGFGSNASYQIQLRLQNSNAGGWGSSIIARSSRGTVAAPTATQTGDYLAIFQGNGYGATGWSTSWNGMFVIANEIYTDAAQGTYLDLLTTRNGGASGVTGLLLDHNGNVAVGYNVLDAKPATTLHVKDRLAATGVTGVTVDAGVNQLTTDLQQWRDTAGVSQGNRVTATGAINANAVTATAQNAAIGATNLRAAAAAGTYRASAYIHTTTQSVGVCTSDVAIGWTYNGGGKTANIVLAHSHAVDETADSGVPLLLRSDAAQNIVYTTTFVGGANCLNAVYDLYVTLERLQ